MGQSLCCRQAIQIRGDGVRSVKEPSVVERSGVIALYGILILTIGFVLVVDWSASDAEGEFIFGEAYTMVLMGSSLVWMWRMMCSTSVAAGRYSENDAVVKPEPGERGAKSHKSQGGSLVGVSLTIFAAFSWILAAFQVTDYIYGLSHNGCSSPTAIACGTMKLLFIPTQVGLILYTQTTVTFTKTRCNGAMVLQVIVTNIVIYTWTFIKSKAGVLTVYDILPATVAPFVNSTHPGTNSTQDELEECVITIYRKLFPWFYPFFLEFCLTASAMLAEQWLECSEPPATTQTQPGPQTNDGSKHDHPEEKKNQGASVRPAMGIGMFALGAQIAVIAILIVEDDSFTAAIIWYATRAVMSAAVIILSAVGLKMLSNCKRIERIWLELDEVLLLTGNVGSLALALFRGFPGLLLLKEGGYAAGVAVTEFVVIVGTVLQTAFISKALHRQPSKQEYIRTASIATVVGLLNVSLWLSNTVDVEGLDHGIYHKETNDKINELQLARYESSWVIFLLLCFPVAIFYRIHSAIVLYRISKEHRKVSDSEELTSVCVWRKTQLFISEYDELSLKKEEFTRRWAEFQQTRGPEMEQLAQEVNQLNQRLGIRNE